MTVTDEMLIAYIDGELDADARAQVEEAARADPALQARLDAHRGLRKAVGDAYAPVAQAAVPDRFTALFERGEGDQEAEVIDIAAARAARQRREAEAEAERRKSRRTTIFAVAACFVVAVMASPFIVSPPKWMQGGEDKLAHGELANALDTQLASTQSPTSLIRIGITFRNKDGALCRSYSDPQQAGLACRAEGRWQIETTGMGKNKNVSAYRQASSSNRAMADAIEQRIDGVPFDAEQERAARDARWDDLR